MEDPKSDLKAHFQRDGYLICRGLIAGDELDRLRDKAEALKARVQAELPPGTRYWTGHLDAKSLSHEERGAASWGINEITREEFFDADLINVLGLPKVDAVTQALLDQPRAWGLKMLWTPKLVGYDLGWHRDQMKEEFYDYIQYKPAAQDHVQYNLALNEDDCFLVVPGSHRRALTDAEWEALRNEKNAVLPGQVETELGPGDILFMDAHALHRGRSPVEGNRLTLHYSAQAQWVPLKPWRDGGKFEWLLEDRFLKHLSPTTRPYYERLQTAERTEDALSYTRAAAKEHGWQAA